MPNKFGNYFAIYGAVALVKGRVKNCLKVMSRVDKYLDNLVYIKKFMEDPLPFKWVGLLFRYGIKNDLKVEFQRIHKKDGDLPIALELDMEILQWADKNNLELLHDIFMIAALEALIQVGEKYKLPTDVFRVERSKYGTIPNTIEECKAYKNMEAI